MSIRKGNEIIAGTLNTEAFYTKSDIDTMDTNVVHKQNTETINGNKKFTSVVDIHNGGIDLVNTNLTKGTTPSSTLYWGIRANDNTDSSTWGNTRLGTLEWAVSSNNIVSGTFNAIKNETSSTSNASLKVIYDTNNNVGYAEAPTPDSLDNSAKIATTRWVFDNVLKIIFPDYTRKVSMTSPYTAPCYGFAMWNNSGTGAVQVNGQTIAVAGNDSYNEGPAFVPLKKGDKLTFAADASLCEFYPCYGN